MDCGGISGSIDSVKREVTNPAQDLTHSLSARPKLGECPDAQRERGLGGDDRGEADLGDVAGLVSEAVAAALRQEWTRVVAGDGHVRPVSAWLS